MAVEIVRTATCRAPVAVAFEYVADYRCIGDWVVAVESFTPVTEHDRGEGAEFEVTARIGVRVHARMRAVEWVDGEVIGMRAVHGFDIGSCFRFQAAGEDLTTVVAEVSYSLPGGPAGRAMGAAVRPVINRTVDHAHRALVQNIEGEASRGRRGAP